MLQPREGLRKCASFGATPSLKRSTPGPQAASSGVEEFCMKARWIRRVVLWLTVGIGILALLGVWGVVHLDGITWWRLLATYGVVAVFAGAALVSCQIRFPQPSKRDSGGA